MGVEDLDEAGQVDQRKDVLHLQLTELTRTSRGFDRVAIVLSRLALRPSWAAFSPCRGAAGSGEASA
jgi:hypothetical protein